MATKRVQGSRPGLIRCEYCGEEYSASYRHCPFCDESGDEYEEEPGKAGGRRLASNKRGGGYGRSSPLKIIGIIISLAVIAAAVWIVVTKLMPAIDRGHTGTVDPDTEISASLPPSGSPSTPGTASSFPGTVPSSPAGVPGVVPSDPGALTSAPPSAVPSAPAGNTGGATGIALRSSDVTLEPNEVWKPTVTFTPAGTTGQVTWSSDNTAAFTVTSDGRVTNVNTGTRQITANLTVTLPNGASASCIVRCKGSGTAAGDPTPPPAVSSSGTAAASYRINNPDFTFYEAGQRTTLRVVDYSGAVSWSSSDSSIVSVDASGVCTAVGTGIHNCTITATLADGTKVTAIARIHI